MGPSQHVRDVIDQVATVAASRFTVLLLGETGTGKELVAQAIHRQSDRRAAPFVALDCGAIPETLMESELFGHEKGSFTGADRKRRGRFQLAEGGTLFLDEVGNLPQNLQSKLLRVLESQQVVSVGGAQATPVNVRFIAATNDDLPARVSEGRFRADLYFRLAQYTLRLPPLRARPTDIPHLAARFAAEASVELRRPVREIAPDAIQFLQRQAWEGNVRELRNVVRQAVLQSKDLILGKERFRAVLGVDRHTTSAPPLRDVQGASLKQIAVEAVERAERDAICRVLRLTKGNKSQAARALQTDYKTLHLKMKNLGIGAKDFRP
jgi:transcriptional regulator with GAF, ATPase, and Fis domain